MFTFIVSHIAKHKGLAFLQESVVGVLFGLLVGLIAMLAGGFVSICLCQLYVLLTLRELYKGSIFVNEVP
jgi:hypothetical protein